MSAVGRPLTYRSPLQRREPGAGAPPLQELKKANGLRDRPGVCPVSALTGPQQND